MKAKDFLNSLFDSKEEVRLRAFSDRKEEGKIPKKYKVKVEEFSTIEKELKELNKNNYGIFFVVNSGGDKDADINKINAQFIEIDNKSIAEQKSLIKQFPLKPSMVIKTRKSLHVYWFIKDGEVEKFRTVQKALIKHFDSDPSGVNESRVMRLPGFYHCKQEPIMVEVLYFNPEYKYTQQELLEVLEPDSNDIEKTSNNETLKDGAENIVSNCEFFKYCEEYSKTLSEPLWFAMIEVLAPFKDGEKIIKKLSKDYPKYSESETDRKIKHCLDNGYHCPTCEKLYELGFECGKRRQGLCNGHSPINMNEKPISVKELLSILNETSFTGDELQDIKLAEIFIVQYLLNLDEKVGRKFISNHIINHFRFNDKDVKRDLINYYSKKKSEKYFKEKYNLSDLPSWYTSKGKNKVTLNVGLLAEGVSDELDILYVSEAFYIYKDGVYNIVDKKSMEQKIIERIFKEDRKTFDINDTLNQLSIINFHSIDEMNTDLNIINLKNGLLDIKNRTLKNHTPSYYSLNQINAKYDEDADCPNFKEFLYDSFEGDISQVKLIQEVMGYLLIPETAAQKAFFLTGEAAAGKSLLANTITYLLGDKNVSKIALEKLDDRFTTALLFGKLANIVAELPTTSIVDNSMFKRISGGDPVVGERKHKEHFDFIPTARLLYTCNNIPRNNSDKSEGFYRRVLIVPFNKVVPVEKRNKKLINIFKEEIDGIFMFALEGLERLIKNDYIFSETEKNKQKVSEFKIESDSALSFVKENCILDKENDTFTTSETLYNHYKDYCRTQGLSAYGINKFIKTITENYKLERRTKNNHRGIQGIEVVQ